MAVPGPSFLIMRELTISDSMVGWILSAAREGVAGLDVHLL